MHGAGSADGHCCQVKQFLPFSGSFMEFDSILSGINTQTMPAVGGLPFFSLRMSGRDMRKRKRVFPLPEILFDSVEPIPLSLFRADGDARVRVLHVPGCTENFSGLTVQASDEEEWNEHG
jgi:hypothetical protein